MLWLWSKAAKELTFSASASSAARDSVEAQVRAGTLAPTKALSLIAEALDKRFKGE